MREYAEHHSEAAFAELVRRHVDLIYSAALRVVGDSHLAKDVTQGVFVALAGNSRRLMDRPVLSGWLHRTAQNIAAKTVRTEVRRRGREKEAAAMNELTATPFDGVWKDVAPCLDAALEELTEPDRDAVLLRYFERKSAQEMAAILGISNEAAQKRVNRAVERLRESLAKRGVTVAASGLGIAISANAVQCAPAGLAAIVAIGAARTSAVIGTTKTIALTLLQKAAVTAAVAAVAGAGVYEVRQNLAPRPPNLALQQQAMSLAPQKSPIVAMRRIQPPDPPQSDLAPATGDIGRELGMAVVNGDLTALDKIIALSRAEHQDFASNRIGLSQTQEGELARQTFAPVRVAFDVIGDAGTKGNQFALDALERSLPIPEVKGPAVQALGVLAGNGDDGALEVLLHPEKYGALLAGSVGALKPAADNGNQKAIDALAAVAEDATKQPLWFMAADGLGKAAGSGNTVAIDALIDLLASTNQSVQIAATSGLKLAAENQNAKAMEALRQSGIQ